jgi:hypothetical protein
MAARLTPERLLKMIRTTLKHQLISALSLLCFAALNASAQTDLAKKQETYQNQQRAARLSSLRTDIKVLDDAPQRCALKIQIARFIYEQKATNYFETANSLALECLDETVDNGEQFSDSNSNWWKSQVLSLLRKYAPDIAAKAEKKYFAGGSDTDLADELDAQKGQDPNGIANRMIEKIADGEMPSSIISVMHRLREADNNAALRLLAATLDHYQSHIEMAYADNNLIFLSWEYLDSRTPLALRQRYHALAVRIGETALAQPQNPEITRIAVELLGNAMSDIKMSNAELYPRAISIYSALSSKRSDYDREKDAATERINASKDKLAQAISEAQSAENKELKNDLWLYASTYALETKKFRVAAESRLKMDTHENSLFKRARDFFLAEQLIDLCVTENDIESALYIAGLIEDPQMKSQGLFKIAAKLVELRKRDAAFDVLNDGWKVLDKVDTGTPKLWAMHLAVPIALKIDKTRAFDMASDMVKVVNRFPTPGPDDKPGTEARRKYASTLFGVSINLDAIFRQLSKENLSLADAIGQGLQLRDWRLAAQIAVETQRVYPLPPELTEKPRQTNK